MKLKFQMYLEWIQKELFMFWNIEDLKKDKQMSKLKWKNLMKLKMINMQMMKRKMIFMRTTIKKNINSNRKMDIICIRIFDFKST